MELNKPDYTVTKIFKRQKSKIKPKLVVGWRVLLGKEILAVTKTQTAACYFIEKHIKQSNVQR